MIINKKDFLRSKVHYPLTPGEALKIMLELQGLGGNKRKHVTKKLKLTAKTDRKRNF